MPSTTETKREEAQLEEVKEEEEEAQEDGSDEKNGEAETPKDFLQKPNTLLELGEETMAQAMLIFLLADLRILSARGMIRTKFEHLSLDSDRAPRLTSQDYAGFYNYCAEDGPEETFGVKASHIMAVLLLEILSEAEDKSRGRPALLTAPEEHDNTASRFRRDIQAANGMPTLLHCYNTMLNDDMRPNVARVSRSLFPLNEDLPEDVRKQKAEALEKTESGLPQQDASCATSSLQKPHFQPIISSKTKSSAAVSGKKDDESDDQDSTSTNSSGRKLTMRERMGTIVPNRIKKEINVNTLLPQTESEREQEEMDKIANVQQQMLKFAEGDSEAHEEEDDTEFHDAAAEETEHPIQLSATQKQSNTDNAESSTTEASNAAGSIPSTHTMQSSAKHPKYHTPETIRTLMREAIQERDWGRLSFIKDFFRPGTVSHTLAKSKSEMVWLSDWHSAHECTYALGLDREKGKVLLAFRGAYTNADWSHVLDYYDTGTSNPVLEDYPDRPSNIRLHAGFYKYLFRVRKDTNTTKYDEIAAKLAHYCELASNNGSNLVRITITGHSLGSALATVFSLYASTEDRFTDNGRAIECVTFGAPCIGNWRFAGAVKHQENMGKLRIAKFHVKGDVTVVLPPTLFRTSTKGAQYFHSGIDILLPYIRNSFFHHVLGGQPKPKVTYNDPDTQSYWLSLLRQLRDFYVWNLPLRFWRFALFHTLVEHRKRMALVNKEKSDAETHEDPDSALLTKFSLKELYDMRNDLSTRKARRDLIKKMRTNNTQ